MRNLDEPELWALRQSLGGRRVLPPRLQRDAGEAPADSAALARHRRAQRLRRAGRRGREPAPGFTKLGGAASRAASLNDEECMVASRLENVISLTKRRGFVYPCGEIYGGTRAAWDYGPFGVELKENIKRQWWRSVVQRTRRRRRPRLLDHPASSGVGRVRSRRRVLRPADRVPELPQAVPRRPAGGELRVQEGTQARPGLAEINCPECGNLGQFTEPRDFNMMLKTYLGVHRGRVRLALPASGDRPGHLRELQERARTRPG